MVKTLLLVLAACLGLGGAASAAGASMLTAKGDVIAIMGGELFLGEAEGHISGAGTLAIHSQKNPRLTCSGKFTSSAELGGKGQLRCTDGKTSTFKFERMTIRRGHGTGSFGKGTMSFSYGLTADEAKPYLKLPKGKQLKHNGTELALVNR